MQGNLPGRASADYSWAFLLHQPLHAHRISAFPTIRFIWTIAIQPARMCEKIPSSPEDALVHTVLSLSSEACGKSPCSSILFAAFSRPYNSPSEICQAYFCLGCFAHSKRDGASPQKPQLRSGLATIHSPASVTSYTLHLRIVRAQKLQTRYFTLYLVLT
jgi:hypothetical protein